MSFLQHAGRARAFLLAGFLFAGLSACALVGNGPAPNIYTLTAPDIEAAGGAAGAQLGLSDILTSAAYDTNRIVYKPNPNEIQYFASARWADRAPRMLQGLLIDALDRSGGFAAVSRKGSGISPDYELRLDLRHFGVEDTDEGKTVHITFAARLADYDADEVIASRSFETVSRTDAQGAAALVKVFDSAFADMTRALNDWVQSEIAQRQTGG